MLTFMILCFAVCGLLAGVGAYLIASYIASQKGTPTSRSPLIAGGVTFLAVWAGMSAGFMHWVATVA